MKKNNSGFTLIEVLLSLIILTVAIVTINAAFKQFVEYKAKMEKYKNIYLTTLSIKDMIETKELSNGLSEAGELNGLKYKYSVKLVAKGKNTVSSEDVESKGKTAEGGSFEIFLYKITLEVENRKYEFFKLQYKKIKGLDIPNVL
jgi:prepilin-type N-terminal cleavage/methylation domain-containing protein